MPQDKIQVDAIWESTPAQVQGQGTVLQEKIPVSSMWEKDPAEQERIKSMQGRVDEIDTKLKEFGGADSIGVAGFNASKLNEQQKLMKERDELLSNIKSDNFKQETAKERETRERIEDLPRGWQAMKTQLSNTMHQIKALPYDVPAGFVAPKYAMEKFIHEGTQSLYDRDIISKEAAGLITEILMRVTETNTPLGMLSPIGASAADTQAYLTEKSIKHKAKVQPTLALIDAIQHGNGTDVAIAAVGGALNYLPSIVVGVLTKGTGFIPMFIGSSFTDAAALKADMKDQEIRELINDYEASSIVPIAVGTVAGVLEYVGLKKLSTFLFDKKLTSGVLNNAKDLMTHSGRQGLINWAEGGLMDLNLDYARTGDVVKATGHAAQFLFSRDGFNQGLEAYAGTLLTAGLSKGTQASLAHYHKRGEKINRRQLGTGEREFKFIGKDGEYFFEVGKLTEGEATTEAAKLQEKYPNMEFEAQNNTDSNDTQAEANWTIKASDKAVEVAPTFTIVEQDGQYTEYQSQEAFLEAIDKHATDAPFAVKGTFINVGLLVGQSDQTINPNDITSKLPKDVKVVKSTQINPDSGTVGEPTLSIELSRPLTEAEMTQLLKDTKQMAIPQVTDGRGTMYGSTEWGAFNAEYFVTPDGKKLSGQAKDGDVAFTVTGANEGAVTQQAIDILKANGVIKPAVEQVKAQALEELGTDKYDAAQVSIKETDSQPVQLKGKLSNAYGDVLNKQDIYYAGEKVGEVSTQEFSDAKGELTKPPAGEVDRSARPDGFYGKQWDTGLSMALRGEDLPLSISQSMARVMMEKGHKEGKRVAEARKKAAPEAKAPTRNNITVSNIRLDKGRGLGMGKDIMRQLNTKAVEQGKKLVSSELQSKDQTRVWDSLVRTGEANKLGKGQYEMLESPEMRIPADVLTKANKAFTQSIEQQGILEADAATEARKSMMRSDWYLALPDNMKADASRHMDSVIERMAADMSRPKTVMTLTTAHPKHTITTNYLDQLKAEQKAAETSRKYTDKEYHNFIDNMRKDVMKALEANQISKPIANTIIDAINKAAKARSNAPKTLQKHLDRLEKAIKKANDPVVKSAFAEVLDRFASMMNFEKKFKIGEGRKVFKGTKTPEYADMIKKLNKSVKESEGKLFDEAAQNNKLEEAIAKEDQSAQDALLEEYTDMGMNLTELADNITELRRVMREFEATDKDAYDTRRALLEEAAEIMDKLSGLEEASIASRAAIREKARVELEERKAERTSYEEATKKPETVKEEAMIGDFRDVIGDDRPAAFSNLREVITKDEGFTQKQKNQIVTELNNIEANQNNTTTEDFNAVQKVLGTDYVNAHVSRTPSPKFGALTKIANFFKGTYYDNLRGLLRWTINNVEHAKEVMKLDKMADWASEKYAELGENSFSKITQLMSIIQLPPGFKKGNMASFREFIGSKVGNSFYVAEAKNGLPTTVEQLDVNGKVITDFNKLSHNDIVYLRFILSAKDNVRILMKSYSKGTIEALTEHVNKHVENTPQLKEFSDYLQTVILPDVYKITNEVYKKRFGTDMPQLANYFRRVAEQDRVELVSGSRSSLIPRHALERGDPGKIKLKGVDVLRTVEDMYQSANRWNAFYDVQKRWENVFTSKQVRDAIVTNIPNGKSVLNNLDAIYKYYPDGVDQKHYGSRLIRNAVMSKIAGNLSMLVKQPSSLPNSMTDFNKQLAHRDKWGKIVFSEVNYAAKLADPRGWADFYKELIKSPTIKDRLRRGHDPSQRAFLSDHAFIEWLESKSVLSTTVARRAMFVNEMLKKAQNLPVKFGDIVPFMAIKPNYQLRLEKYRSEGMEFPAASKKAFERSASEAFRTQQPAGRAHLLSGFQVSQLGRNIPYITAPVQMGQNFREGVRDVLNKYSTPSDRVAGLRNVFYYGYVQPMIWAWAASTGNSVVKYMFTGREDEEKVAGASKRQIEEAEDMYNTWDMITTGVLQGYPMAKVARDQIAYRIQDKPWKPSIMPAIAMLDELMDDVAYLAERRIEKPYQEWTDYEKYRFNRFVGNALGTVTGHGFPSLFKYRRDVIQGRRSKPKTKEEFNNIFQ